MSGYPDGSHYRLPDGFDWLRVAAERERWEIDARFVPLGAAGGVVAWGRLLPCDYTVAQ